jgi:hypothetical protein
MAKKAKGKKTKKLDPVKDFDKPVRRTPRTGRLLGMEDPAIEALEEKALEYNDVRDERMRLSKREGELQDLIAVFGTGAENRGMIQTVRG